MLIKSSKSSLVLGTNEHYLQKDGPLLFATCVSPKKDFNFWSVERSYSNQSERCWYSKGIARRPKLGIRHILQTFW